MKILSVNAGSSSLKFTLFEMPEEKELISGVFERIGIDSSFYTIKFNGEKIKKEVELKDHKAAFELLVKELIDNKIVESLEEIKGIGHRIVQGGAYFDKTVLATEDNISIVEKLSSLAPLHNPAAVVGIRAAQSVFPNATETLVFDTAFHQTMEEEVYLYPVPYEWYTKYGVRKYGFHGTSHCFISKQIPRLLGRDNYKAIICHLGSGASLSAVKDGKCVDTTMGFTPLAGVMMGTRSGDIDPSIIPYIMQKCDKSIDEVMNDLNKKSGFLGMSEYSSDCRDIEDGMAKGNELCSLAFEKYMQCVVNYIASYYVELGGCDIICFTAGLGENGPAVRSRIIEKLACLGIKLDLEKNNTRGEEKEISADDSSVKVFVVPTNEELMIAEDTLAVIENR